MLFFCKFLHGLLQVLDALGPRWEKESIMFEKVSQSLDLKLKKSLRSEFGDCLDSVVLLYYCATAFVIRLKEPKNYRLWHFKPFRNSGQNTLQIAILAEIIRHEWERHRPLPLKLQL